MAKKTNRTQKKFPKLLPWLISGILVLTVLIVIITATSGGPVVKLRRAMEKTVFADSFTTIFQLSVNDKSYDGNLNVAIDTDKREVMFYLQLATDTTDYICGIYKDDFALCDASTNDLQVTNVKDRLAAFFDALEDGSQPDWALLLDFSEFDLHEKVTDDFDIEILTECIGNFLNDLNDPDWAKTYAGYTTDRESGVTLHKFSPSPDVLAEQVIPTFREAFLKTDRYDALVQYADDAKYLLAAGTADLTFGVKYGRLVSAQMDIRYHNASVQGNFEFIGINSTIVDFDTIAYFIDQAGKSPSERYEDQFIFD